VLGEQLAHERGRVGGGVHEALPVVGPGDLGLALDLAGQLLGASVGDDAPVRQDEDAVGQLLRLGEVVRRQQDRGALHVRQPVHHVMEVAPGHGVEPGCRLVEEQQLRATDDADRDVESSSLTTRQGGDLRVGELGQTGHHDQLTDVVRAGATRRRVRLVEAAQLGEQLARRPPWMVAP
jgi:hypothetical protein